MQDIKKAFNHTTTVLLLNFWCIIFVAQIFATKFLWKSFDVNNLLKIIAI